MVAEVCRIVSELHIPKEAMLEANIRKLVASIRNANVEAARVQFDLNIKFTKLELKSQSSTPPKVREQHEAIVKDAIATVDVAMVDYIALFE